MKGTIFHIVKKEFIQFRQDKRMLFISIIVPIVQLILLGYAANIDVKDLPIVICDMDNSKISREYSQTLTDSGFFYEVERLDKMNEIDNYIDDGKALIGIIIPQNFEKNILAEKTTQVQSIVDGSDSNSATIGMNYLSMITTNYSQKFVIKKVERLQKMNINPQIITNEIRVWYNPELKSKNFMVPGVFGMILMITTLILTSLAIIKEKENGTFEQLIVSPIKPFELILGKLIPFTLVGIIDIILVLLVATLWFNIPIKGNVILLFILSIIFLLSTLGLGLFVSTVVSTQQQAMMTSIFFIQMPMMFLSGFIFPIENMPKIIQFITYVMPLRYYFSIVRGIFLKGVGIVELWKDALMLIILSVLIFISSVVRFHKRVG
jgi:ABC-2 type transport system permease protein